MQTQKVEETVKAILVDVLGLEDDETEKLTAAAHLVDDLGAESIDFIDICFRLETGFKLGKVTPEQIFPRFLREEEMVDKDGRLKPERKQEAMERLQRQFPHLQRGLIQKLNSTNDARITVSVGNVVAFVEHKLGQPLA